MIGECLMNEDEFLGLYWKNYILLEKEFSETLEYITLDVDNYNVYSSRYIKLLLQIGSEIDINAKLFCKQYNAQSQAKKIDHYRNEITSNEVDFCNTKVDIIQHCNILSFMPWESWNRGINPNWWTAYNKVKHERFQTGNIGGATKEYYKFANLEYTLLALGGLYQLLIYRYFKLINGTGNWVKTPIPGSHMFKLTGNKWDGIDFYQDVAFHVDIDTGHLLCEMGVY